MGKNPTIAWVITLPLKIFGSSLFMELIPPVCVCIGNSYKFTPSVDAITGIMSINYNKGVSNNKP